MNTTCLTKPSFFTNSCCLVEKPECVFAKQFGFSYLCTHQDHKKFQGHIHGLYSRQELFDRYKKLKDMRRDEFVASLDDFSRAFFSK